MFISTSFQTFTTAQNCPAFRNLNQSVSQYINVSQKSTESLPIQSAACEE